MITHIQATSCPSIFFSVCRNSKFKSLSAKCSVMRSKGWFQNQRVGTKQSVFLEIFSKTKCDISYFFTEIAFFQKVPTTAGRVPLPHGRHVTGPCSLSHAARGLHSSAAGLPCPTPAFTKY